MKATIAVLVLILLGLQFRLWTGQGSFAHIHQLNSQIAAQEEANAELEQRNDRLLADVEELKTGLDAIEERARHELGMVREGETFYMIVEE